MTNFSTTDGSAADALITASASRDTSGQTALDAYHRLKRDIVRGVYPPASKLAMQRLKAHYDIGVGPLREALTRLIGERLVTSVNQRGYRVAPMSLPELEALYDARAVLEGLLVELALERGDDDWEAAVVANAHRLAKITRIDDGDAMLDVWDTRHQALHDAIVAGCGSPPLLQSRAALFDQAQRYRHLWLRDTVFSPQALAAKHAEHETLVERVLDRDPGAVALVRQHLMTPVPIIRERLRHQGWA